MKIKSIGVTMGKVALITVFLHLAITAPFAQEQSNPVLNADFETGNLTSWTSPQQGGGSKTIHNAVAGSRVGTFTLEITGDTANQYNSFLSLVQTLSVTPHSNEQYTLSCNVRAAVASDTGKSVYLAVKEIDAQGQTIVFRQAMVNLQAQDWKRIYCSFSPTANTASLSVCVVASNLVTADKVYMDDIILNADYQGKNLVMNGDFETNDLTNWTSPQQSGGAVVIYKTAPGSSSGLYAAKIAGDTNNIYNGFLTLVQTLAATPNTQLKYTLCGTVRADVATPAGKSVYLAIREVNSQGGSIIYRQANINLSNRGWCNTSCEFSPTAATVRFDVYVVAANLANSDKIWVDDIKFTVNDGQNLNLVKNGNFETGNLTNWTSPQQSGGSVIIHNVMPESQVGRYVVEANGDTSNPYNGFLTLTQTLSSVTPDSQKSYMICGYVCAKITPLNNPYDVTDNRTAYLAIREVNSLGGSIIYRKAPIDLTRNGWVFVYCEFTPTTSTTRFDAYLVISNLGDNDKVFVDNITLITNNESTYAFNPDSSYTPSSQITLNDGGLQVIVDNQYGVINKITATSLGNTILQPAAVNGMQIFAETLFGKCFTKFQKKAGTTVVQNGNTLTYQLEPADRTLLPLTGTAVYELANGILTEKITINVLDTIERPVKIGVRNGFNSANWQQMVCGLRPLRVLNSNQATVFAYDEKSEDMNLNHLDQYQRVAYPVAILSGTNALWLAGSRNLDEFVSVTPNHPAGYFPSIQQNPTRLNAGQTLNFTTSFKVFDPSQNLLRDVWRWYNQNISSSDPIIASYVPYQPHSYRTFFPGCFAASPGFNTTKDSSLFPGSSIWWFGWHDWINEAYPASGMWWTSANLWAEKMTSTAMLDRTTYLQNTKNFNLIYYFRQIANLRLKGSLYPESWYRLSAGGSLDLYDGGLAVELPANIAADVGYDTVPWGTYNFDNQEFRTYYIDNLMSAVGYYQPKAVGWDMGWESGHRGMFRVQAEVFNLLRSQYPAMKTVSNESCGPTQFYSDLVLLENGILGGKSVKDYEAVKALNTAAVVLERKNLFALAVGYYLDGTSCWLPAQGVAENGRYLAYLLAAHPELSTNRPELARLCTLRMCLYDLALGASPGYLEEVKPVPAALSTTAGKILGMPLVTDSFKVRLASGSDIDDQQAASVWIDANSCRVVIYNDKAVSTAVVLRLSYSALTNAGWTPAQVTGGTAMIVTPEGESSGSLTIQTGSDPVTFSITLPAFSGLIYSKDK